MMTREGKPFSTRAEKAVSISELLLAYASSICWPRADAAGQSDDIDPAADEIGDQGRQALVAGVAETVFDRDVVAFDVAGLRQTLAKRHLALRVGIGRAGIQVADYRHRRLLRPSGERP